LLFDYIVAAVVVAVAAPNCIQRHSALTLKVAPPVVNFTNFL
jgi:hypothetical protein